MDFGHYAEAAVDLVNNPPNTASDLRYHLESRPWLAGRVTESDVNPLAQFASTLATVIDASADGNAERVVDTINALLAQHPVHPRISGHDESSWHLHVSDLDATVADVLMAEALFGLTLLITEMGATRLGRCAAEGCGKAFLDTSTNRTRRFCSNRCSSRTNVANFRSRRQSQAKSP